MSLDIDMKDYAGELKDPAAVGHDTNSYQQEAFSEEFPVRQDLMQQQDASSALDLPEAATNAPSPQELNFRALREEVDRMKAERDIEKREHQLQLDILRANGNKPQEDLRQNSNQMFRDMKDDDIPNVGELRREWEAKEANYQARLEELQVAQQYPDYAEVVEKFALPLVKQKPHLAQGLQGATNKALFAYELGKMAQQMQIQQRTPSPAPHIAAQRMIDNSRKPASLAQTGGQSTLSQADYYATMSDNEFAKFASRNLEQI